MRAFNFTFFILGFAFFAIFSTAKARLAAAKGIEARFQGRKKLVYEVYFNGVPSGHVEWEHLGRRKIEGREVDVLSLDSDTKIFKLLSLAGEEKVFFDSETLLPVRVERDIVYFGKKEFIEEIYDQQEGTVKIKKRNSQSSERVISQDKPIHNILALLYFFPRGVELEAGKWMIFNLPTQKVKIKMVRERLLNLDGARRNTYFLVGRGSKRFSLWLDKEERLPLRLEFISLTGKVTVLRDLSPAEQEIEEVR
jgi:hypothetical protein